MIEPEHWLLRLDAAAWLKAARVEWQAAHANVARRRTAIAHCRRAGGMALNAVLVAWGGVDPIAPIEAIWGRSYVAHLERLAAGEHGPLDADAGAAAAEILATPMAAPPLVTLGARAHADLTAVLDATLRLLDACEAACGRLERSL